MRPRARLSGIQDVRISVRRGSGAADFWCVVNVQDPYNPVGVFTRRTRCV